VAMLACLGALGARFDAGLIVVIVHGFSGCKAGVWSGSATRSVRRHETLRGVCENHMPELAILTHISAAARAQLPRNRDVRPAY
jgi:hypothetical protein